MNNALVEFDVRQYNHQSIFNVTLVGTTLVNDVYGAEDDDNDRTVSFGSSDSTMEILTRNRLEAVSKNFKSTTQEQKKM